MRAAEVQPVANYLVYKKLLWQVELDRNPAFATENESRGEDC
jgi:hypothetical protein